MAGDRDAIDFVTMGMFIIDEIEFPPPKPPVKDVIGGAGTYSALGARLFSPGTQAKSVGWIIDCGSDFPQEIRDTIASWNTGVLMRETPHRLTTRSWNGYGEHEHRAFRYTTPKLRLDHDDLPNTDLIWSKSFHLICSATRCISLVEKILALRGSAPRPLFIWEPVPDLCTPEEFVKCCKALKHIDVVSPNHSELGALFSKNTNGTDYVEHRVIENLCEQWLQSGIGQYDQGAIVVRAGKDGCFVARKGFQKWLPAYHQSAEKAVDPTGGGNTFLGGLAVGLVRGGGLNSVAEAAAWGSVSASFAIEQIGCPTLSRTEKEEIWNDSRVDERLSEFKERLDRYVQP